MADLELLVTDRAIEVATLGTDIRKEKGRERIREGLLKIACGYGNGSTVNRILHRTFLIHRPVAGREITMTEKGRKYLFYACHIPPTL